MQTADWVVVVVYLGAVLALGLYMARGQRSKRDYFLGSRQLSWWVVGLSIVATETSALTFVGVPAKAMGSLSRTPGGALAFSGGNLLCMQLTAGYVVARLIVAAVMVPHYFRGDVYTPYQVLSRAFGAPPRYLAAVLSLCSMCLQAGIRVYVTAIPVMVVMRVIFPWWGIWWSVVSFCVVAIAYTAVGGIRAVVWTDMVQFFIFFFGGLFAVLYIPTLLVGELSAPGGATGWAALMEVGREKLQLLHWGLAPRVEGQGLGAWLLACVAELFGGDFNIWMGLVGGTVGVMVSHGADQLNVQRVLACKNARGGRRALVLSAVIIAPQFLIFLLVGVGLYVFYTLGGFDFSGIPPWDPTLASPEPKADYVFPIFIVTHVPVVIRGLLMAGILAAAMSSLTSALTAISSVAILDLLQPLTGILKSAKQEVALGRAGTLLTGFVLVGVAWWAKDAPLIFNFVFQFAGIFSGAKLGALLLAMRAKQQEGGRSGPVVAGMLASAAVMGCVVAATRSGWVTINWPWYPALGTAVCVGVAWVAGLFGNRMNRMGRMGRMGGGES